MIADKECPEQEVYSQCGRNKCQDTCAEPNKKINCTDKCRPGCVCQEGWIRDSNGICTLPALCDSKTTFIPQYIHTSGMVHVFVHREGGVECLLRCTLRPWHWEFTFSLLHIRQIKPALNNFILIK